MNRIMLHYVPHTRFQNVKKLTNQIFRYTRHTYDVNNRFSLANEYRTTINLPTVMTAAKGTRTNALVSWRITAFPSRPESGAARSANTKHPNHTTAPQNAFSLLYRYHTMLIRLAGLPESWVWTETHAKETRIVQRGQDAITNSLDHRLTQRLSVFPGGKKTHLNNEQTHQKAITKRETATSHYPESQQRLRQLALLENFTHRKFGEYKTTEEFFRTVWRRQNPQIRGTKVIHTWRK